MPAGDRPSVSSDEYIVGTKEPEAMEKWTAADTPSQVGRTALVTGANSGLGSFTSLELARHGAHVIMGVRNKSRGDDALARLKAELPNASVELQLLDLADLDDVKALVSRFVSSRPSLDLLINNAGVMLPPRRATKQGFELQFGVNHLGHFALTLPLLPLIERSTNGRVVAVSSAAHRSGRINFDDLQSERSYKAFRAYAQSKIANVYFALELDRRLREAGSRVKSVLAHPGVAATNLASSLSPPLLGQIATLLFPLIGQSPAHGALPTLYAATALDVQGGEFFGPAGIGEMRGSPRRVRPVPIATDTAIAERLWEISEYLTGSKLEEPT